MNVNITIQAKRRSASSTDYNVFVSLTGGGLRQVIYTGQRVPKDDWSESNNMPKNTKGAPYLAIEKIRGDLNRTKALMIAKDEVLTPASLKSAYYELESEQDADQKVEDDRTAAGQSNVLKLAETYIKNNLFKYKPNTKKAVKSNINVFIDFLKLNGYTKLELKKLNMQIITAYEKQIVDWEYSIGSRGIKMKHLRWFLDTLDFDTKKIKVATSQKTLLSLTLEELQLLEAVDVSKNSQWQKAKDMFLLGCYLGLRISDLKQITPATIKIIRGKPVIKMKLVKNQRDVTIPIMGACMEILKRYGNAAPNFPEQKVNEYIKLVCKEAKINEPTVVEWSKGDKTFKKTVPKHELITTHISGKTFITLAPARWGLTVPEIAHIVGKNVNTLLKHYFNDQSEIGRQKMFDNDRPLMQISKAS